MQATVILSIGLLALAFSAAAQACTREFTVRKETIGGQEITQLLIKVKTHKGCTLVLLGGTSESYVEADTCISCERSKSGDVACKGPPLAFYPTCGVAIGPDCKPYKVDKVDKKKPCAS